MQERPDIWIKGGLVAPKHWRAMREARWLYDYLLQMVNFKDDPDRGPAGWTDRYTHADAADTIGCSLRTVKYWFERLLAAGYIEATRHQYNMEVTITKYVPPGERARERKARNGAGASYAPEVQAEVQETALLEDQKCKQKCKNTSPEVQAEVQEFALPSISTTVQQITTEQTAVAPNGAVKPYDVFLAFCQETGTDPKRVTKVAKDGTLKYAKELLTAQYDIDSMLRCYRYLLQEEWRKGSVKLATVAKEIADWHAQGEPSEPAATGTGGGNQYAGNRGNPNQNGQRFRGGSRQGGQRPGTEQDRYAYERELLRQRGELPEE